MHGQPGNRRPPLCSERPALHTVAVFAVVVGTFFVTVVVAVVAVIGGYGLLSFSLRYSGSFLVCSQRCCVGVGGCYASFLPGKCGDRDRRDCTVVVAVVVPAAIESCSCTPFSRVGSASSRHGGPSAEVAAREFNDAETELGCRTDPDPDPAFDCVS